MAAPFEQQQQQQCSLCDSLGYHYPAFRGGVYLCDTHVAEMMRQNDNLHKDRHARFENDQFLPSGLHEGYDHIQPPKNCWRTYNHYKLY